MVESKAVNAQATASITAGQAEGSLSLERDSTGQDQERAIVPMYIAVPPGVLRFDGADDGFSIIRLWDTASIGPALYVSGANATHSPQVERLGTRTDTLTEILTFSGSKEASLSKGVLAQNVTILAQSIFIGPTPSYSNGAFRASGETFGSIVVQYTARYTAYKIYYNLPDWVVQRIFRDGIDEKDITIPPVLVMAYASGISASMQIERRIASTVPTSCNNNEWEADPDNCQYIEYKIYPDSEMDNTVTPPVPKPNANFLTNKAYLKYTEFCKAEHTRKRQQTFTLPRGNNIEVVYPIQTGIF